MIQNIHTVKQQSNVKFGSLKKSQLENVLLESMVKLSLDSYKKFGIPVTPESEKIVRDQFITNLPTGVTFRALLKQGKDIAKNSGENAIKESNRFGRKLTKEIAKIINPNKK